MNELSFLYNKYKERDVIQISGEEQVKMIEWAAGKKSSPASLVGGIQIDLREMMRKLSERGFIRFLNKGVVFVTHRSDFKNVSVYPFEFIDDDTCIISIYISNPSSTNVSQLELLCKAIIKSNISYMIEDGSYNHALALDHLDAELETDRLDGHLQSFAATVEEEHPEFKRGTHEYNQAIVEAYLQSIVKAQILSVLIINTYFVMLDKEQLVAKIEQKRDFTASNRKEAKRSKRMLTYRYVPKIPSDYRPRAFNLNYILENWSRAGFKRLVWVRPENAELIAKKDNGQVTTRTKGELVGVVIPIKPTTCHRQKPNKGEQGVKQYT